MIDGYEAVPDLRHIYLEDSYVLGIHEVDGALLFDLLAVLTEDHPAYQAPANDEQYCYRAVRLSFEGNLNFDWIGRSFDARTVDPDGSIDYGNVDGFEILPDGYYLEGDWGAVIVRCDLVKVVFRD